MTSSRDPRRPLWQQLLERSEQVRSPTARGRLVSQAAEAFFQNPPGDLAQPTCGYRARAEALYHLSQGADDDQERRRLLLLAAHYQQLTLTLPKT